MKKILVTGSCILIKHRCVTPLYCCTQPFRETAFLFTQVRTFEQEPRFTLHFLSYNLNMTFMKSVNMVKYLSILGIILTFIGACLKTGGDATSLIVVLISSLIFIPASFKKVRAHKRIDNTEKTM